MVVEIRGPGCDPAGRSNRSGNGRPVYDAPGAEIQYFDDSDQLFVDFEGRARMLCVLGEGL